jgi:hypothetical protein
MKWYFRDEDLAKDEFLLALFKQWPDLEHDPIRFIWIEKKKDVQNGTVSKKARCD